MSFLTKIITGKPAAKFIAKPLRFATREEAEGFGLDLACNWQEIAAYLVDESADPVNAIRHDATGRINVVQGER